MLGLSLSPRRRRTFAEFHSRPLDLLDSCFEINWNFLSSHHFPIFFTPHSVAFLVFFGWAFCSISPSCSLFKSDFDWKRADLPFWNKISNSTELQSEQVQIRASFRIEIVSSGSHWPIKIRATNEFCARVYRVWPAKWRILQRAVSHLAVRIDNNCVLQHRIGAKRVYRFFFFRFSGVFISKLFFLWFSGVSLISLIDCWET